jgi:hypothetical protein
MRHYRAIAGTPQNPNISGELAQYKGFVVSDSHAKLMELVK